MPYFEVTTESGADYWIDTDDRFWSHRQQNVDRLGVFKVALVATPGLPWAAPDDWADASEPVVGRRMYLSSMNYWRISTPVAEFRDIDAREAEDAPQEVGAHA